MGLLMLFFGGVAKDILAATVFLRRRQNQKADETVRRWKWRRKISFVNWYLKRKAGKPANFMERKRNSADFYEVRNLLVLGRVLTGAGGDLILATATEVLQAEFPEVAERIRYHIPGEKEKRHGQAIAAASLPSISTQETH